MTKKLLALALVMVLFASEVGAVSLNKTELHTVSGRNLRLVVNNDIPRAALKGGIMGGLEGGAFRYVWPVLGRACTLLGIAYMVCDITGIIDWMMEQPDVVVPPTTTTYQNTTGVGAVISVMYYDDYTIPPGICGTLYTGYTITYTDTQTSITYQGGQQYCNQEGYKSYWVYINGQRTFVDFRTSPSCTIVDNTSGQTGAETNDGSINETAVDENLDTAISMIEAGEAGTEPSLETEAPSPASANIPMPGSEPTIIELGTDSPPSTDPQTGEVNTPTVNPSQDTDPMTTPGQPMPPELDTTIISPEQKDISELITGWLANAPFLSVITGLSVQASGGQSSFTIPLPACLGGSGTIDFGQFSDLWSAIAVIIIAISYIYGAMIVFGGR